MTPRVSIVIPTHNRRATLQRGLESLVAQSYPLALTEVIVVADGCTDGTEQISLAAPLTGTVIAQPWLGAAAARNRGAARATGDLLLFLDDDVEAWPDLVQAHVRAHASIPEDALIVGYLPPRPEASGDLFRAALRGWWDAMFERMREPGHRFTYTDVLTGNCSISRRLFQIAGGFQEQLRCHEDYELGLRVLRAGGAIAFEPGAGGWHDDVTDFPRSLRRKREEGTADVWIARAHHDVWPALPLARPCVSRRARLLRQLALNRPLAGRLFDAAARRYVTLLARARLRVRWRVVRDDLLFYWYWRGVADALKDNSFESFREEITAHLPPPPALPTLDLHQGLAAAIRELDRLDAPGIVLQYGSVHVGTIEPQPWAEPLRGRHLRHLLSTTFFGRLAEALAATHTIAAISPPALQDAGVLVSRSRAVSDDDDRL